MESGVTANTDRDPPQWRQIPSSRGSAPDPEKAALIITCGLVAGYAACICLAFTSHVWLLDAQGRPVPFDFLVFWSAGHLVLAGHATAVFSLSQLRAAEVGVVGHAFPNVLPWPYPPLFLFVATSLACLPYVWAFVAWIGTTLAALATAISLVARRRAAFLVALAPPWILFGVLNGQNGFLTASIIAAVLLTLERRPALSGLLLGLLCYKPQLAVLFPVALASAGNWRAFAWAALGVVLWTAFSAVVFGPGIFIAFLSGISAQNHIVLAGNGVAPFNLQSLYGLLRWIGAGAPVSGGLQLCLSLACAFSVIVIWRSAAHFELKAAALAAAIPLATPYLFVSDLAILSVAIAFLFREKPFDRWECGALAFAMTVVFAFLFRTYPAGLFASLAINAVVWRRQLQAFPRRRDAFGFA
jgi:hypothetical protein